MASWAGYFLLAFVAFNLFMLAGLIAGLGSAANATDGLSSEAERAGAAIGVTLGVGMILTLWALGDIILGAFVLLTRGRKVIVETVG